MGEYKAWPGGPVFFKKTAVLARTNTVGASIISDDEVGVNGQVHILGILVKNSGATAWTDSTATKVSILDRGGTPVEAVAIAKAGLTDSALLGLHTANVTVHANVAKGSGLTKGKGLVVKPDASFAAGTDLYVTVFGLIDRG